jgi:hypothetical protein
MYLCELVSAVRKSALLFPRRHKNRSECDYRALRRLWRSSSASRRSGS